MAATPTSSDTSDDLHIGRCVYILAMSDEDSPERTHLQPVEGLDRLVAKHSAAD